MVVHIALFSWKEGVPNQDIEQALADVKALKDKVPDIVDIHTGANVSRWSEGYTHAVVVIGKTKLSIQEYRDHPDHITVAKLIETMEEKSLGVDFEDFIVEEKSLSSNEKR